MSGFFLGFFFWKNAERSLDFGDETANLVVKWMIIGTFALGCGFVLVARCIILATIITALNIDGQEVIQCAIAAHLFQTVGRNLVNNFQLATDAIACNLEISRNITKTRTLLMKGPVEEIVSDMMHGASYSRRIAMKLPEYLGSLENEIGKIQDTKLVKKMRQRMMEINAAEIANKKSEGLGQAAIDRIFKARNSTLVHRMSKFRRKLVRSFIEKATFQCEDIINSAFAKCREWFNKKLSDCVSNFPLNPVCLAYTLDAVCSVMKMIDFREYHCNSEATEFDKYAEEYGAKIDEAENLTDRLVNSFKINVQFKARFPFRFPKLISLSQLRSVMSQAFSVLSGFFVAVSTLCTVVSVMIVFVILWFNYDWFKKYQTDVRHENDYLTPRWTDIDHRRQAEHRSHLLPLRPFEKQKIRTPLTLKPTDIEKRQLLKGISKAIIYFFIVIVSLVEVDKQFYYLLSLVKKYSGVVVSQKGYHEIRVEIEGTGMVAQMLSSMLQNFDRSFSVDQILDNTHCRINPTATRMEDVLWIWSLFAVLVFQCTAGVYLIRIRLLIASLLMPERQYTRILWLYNNMLRERSLFVRQRMIDINRMAMNDDLPVPSFFELLFQRSRCLFCDQKIGRRFHSCWKHEQVVLYCGDCWTEYLDKRCIACDLQYESILDDKGRMKPKYIRKMKSNKAAK